MVITARLIQGASADLWGPIAQLYVAEIPEPDLRDSLGSLSQFELAFGMILSYAVGGLLRYTENKLLFTQIECLIVMT
jgi:MFS family permease